MTTTASQIIGRAKANSPCPVCEFTSKGCSRTEDGLHFCRVPGADSRSWKDVRGGKADSAGFHHYRRVDDAKQAPHRNGKPRTPHAKPNAKPSGPQTWREQAEAFAAARDVAAIAAIGANLGLPAEAFDRERMPTMLLGYTEFGTKDGAGDWVGAVTFPMADAQREPCGILKRLDLSIGDMHKYSMPGSKLGLILGLEWKTRPGPLLIVEGGSDTVSLAVCGLAAIGRPSNVTGAEILAELLADFPADRRIVVVGENDKKLDGKWPGKEGIDAVSPKLAATLKRPIHYAYPPEGIKDCRDWVRDELANQADALDLSAVENVIRQHVETTAAEYASAEAAEPAAPRFTFIDSREFLFADYRREFLIPRILVKGEAGTIAGPSKGLKTTIAVDAAISLASNKPTKFLGEFHVSRPARVAIVSGESGAATLQETARRILRAKELEAENVFDRLQWCFDLPQFADLAQMLDFAERLKGLGAEVVFIDPVYLCIAGSVDHANLFEMGAAFRVVAEVLLKAGITPILIHHANRQLKAGPPMELQHLAYSGLEQFARQFILINRQSAYEGDGRHPLWLSAGGSAGHGGLWDVQIEEGTADDSFGGRFWSVKVNTLTEAKAGRIDERDAARKEAALKKRQHDEAEVLLAIDAECTRFEGATKTALRERTGLNTKKVDETISSLEEAGRVKKVEFQKEIGNGAKKAFKGYARVLPEHPDK